MKYVDYGYYTNEYGGTLTEAVFDKHVKRASAYVNYVTMGRANAALGQFEEEIKSATCAVLEEQVANENGELSSQTVGPWTRVYTASGKTTDQKLNDAAEHYLLFTGLMYRGAL